jgi:putative ABC transport system permease protein
VPRLLAQRFGTKVGDSVVVVATNKDGLVNGKTFVVSGLLESASGPGGRDGYINFDDAREILRMPAKQDSEIAVSVKSLGRVEAVAQSIRGGLDLGEKRQKGGGGVEVDTWSELSPFANIAKIIDLMTFFIKLILIAIVLFSILNVMIMAVYERVREIKR